MDDPLHLFKAAFENTTKIVVLKVLTNKCRCKQDVALYNCCNIEYNHGKIFTMIAKPMKNWELQSL